MSDHSAPIPIPSARPAFRPHPADPIGPSSPLAHLDALATWFDATVDPEWSRPLPARLYGIVLRPPSPPNRVLLAQGWVYDLLDGPAAPVATRYGALGLVCFGRATNLDTGSRRRCRTILVADRFGMTTISRMRGDAPLLAGPPVGPVPDLVRCLFERAAHDEGGPPCVA